MCTLGHNVKQFYCCMYVFTMVAVKKFKTSNTVSIDNAEVLGQPGECQCLEVKEMKKKKGKQH